VVGERDGPGLTQMSAWTPTFAYQAASMTLLLYSCQHLQEGRGQGVSDVLVPRLFAVPIDTDIASVEPGTDVLELPLESVKALTCRGTTSA
jgi:hypothetical protein